MKYLLTLLAIAISCGTCYAQDIQKTFNTELMRIKNYTRTTGVEKIESHLSGPFKAQEKAAKKGKIKKKGSNTGYRNGSYMFTSREEKNKELDRLVKEREGLTEKIERFKTGAELIFPVYGNTTRQGLHDLKGKMGHFKWSYGLEVVQILGKDKMLCRPQSKKYGHEEWILVVGPSTSNAFEGQRIGSIDGVYLVGNDYTYTTAAKSSLTVSKLEALDIKSIQKKFAGDK